MVKDSFAFAVEIVERDPEVFVGRLDVDSLFTNILLEETIDICTNTLFENTEKVEGLSKIEFKELLSLATKESYFLTDSFTSKLKRIDYKIVHLALSLITTGGMLMISLFYLPHLNI